MKNNKAQGITSDMLKALGKDGIGWLNIILIKFPQQQKLPDDIKDSEITTMYTNRRAM